VPEGDREHAVARGANHQRYASRGPRQQHGFVGPPEAAAERHPLARDESPDDLERLLEARHAVVVPQAERAILGVVPPGAEPENEAPAGDLVDRRCHLRDQSRRMKRCARHERAEADALGRGRQRCEQRPCFPRTALLAAVAPVEQMVSEPNRVETDLLGRARKRHVLRPTHVALDLGMLHADLHRTFL
jgi:hypothetical protein